MRVKDLTDGQNIKTLKGEFVTSSVYMANQPGRSAVSTRTFINDALVVPYCINYTNPTNGFCEADVVTGNGVVLLIDQVLIPYSS
jgi:hypothetical protein